MYHCLNVITNVNSYIIRTKNIFKINTTSNKSWRTRIKYYVLRNTTYITFDAC